MTTFCKCGQALDDLEFDEECPGCAAEKQEEERERRWREEREEQLLASACPYRFGFGANGFVVGINRDSKRV